MPTNLTIVHPEDFTRVTQTGTLDLDASRGLLREIVGSLKTTGVSTSSSICDRPRRVSVSPTRSCLNWAWRTARSLPSRAAESRCSVRLDEPADAEFFESVARGQGTNVRAFTEFEPATAWLVMRTAPV